MGDPRRLALRAKPPRIPRAYMGSPLGAPTREGVYLNWLRGLYALRTLVDEGYSVFAGHLIYPLVLDEHDPSHRELGISLDLAMLGGRSFDRVVLFTPDGTTATLSSGMRRDYDRAHELDYWQDAHPVDRHAWGVLDIRRLPDLPAGWGPTWLLGIRGGVAPTLTDTVAA